MPSIAEMIGQMLLVGFEGTSAPDYLLNWISQGRVSGVILFARNVMNPDQLASLTRHLHQASSSPLLIAIDQEGGSVARLRHAQGFTESPSAMALSATHSPIVTERVSAVLGAEMHSLGINWTYAPVVDISYNQANPTVGTRSFGNDPKHIARMAAAAVNGFQQSGVAACAKHFPGLGNTATDTHLALPRLDTPLDHLIAQDLEPYRIVIQEHIASVMTTHTIFSALDGVHPATLSPQIIQPLLRDRLGFEGVVITDCLEMKAIADHYGAGESAILAALAGIDMILFSHTPDMQSAAYDALLDAATSGRIPTSLIEAAYARIQALKTRFAINPAEISAVNVGSSAHQTITDEAAIDALTLVREDDLVFPLNEDSGRILVVEFASYMDSEVMERNEPTSFMTRLREEEAHFAVIPLSPSDPAPDAVTLALREAEKSDVVVIATRNAHLLPKQAYVAKQLASAALRAVIHIALRNPYDAGLVKADVVLCTCGDSVPSLRAAARALFGRATPKGSLPVPLE